MRPYFGFVVLSYDAPDRLQKLTELLDKIYENPPIVVNHDFSQCPLDTTSFPSNVRFCQPHVKTAWGSITCIQAALGALDVLYRDYNPEWFFLISGSDIPIRSANDVRNDLEGAGADAYLDHRLIDLDAVVPESVDDPGFNSALWINIARERYLRLRMSPSWLLRRLRLTKADWLWQGPVVASYRKLQLRGLRLYGGAHWFTANALCAERLLQDHVRRERLQRYFTGRFIPEESFYQTFLANYADLKIQSRSFRYEKWRLNSPNPDWLDESHLEEMLRSGSHFARKVPAGSPLFELVRRHLAR